MTQYDMVHLLDIYLKALVRCCTVI